MPAKSHEQRFDRLEQIVQILAEDNLVMRQETARAQKLIGDLATETRRGFELMSARGAEIDRRMLETDERMRQTDERMRQTDERMRQTDERFRLTDGRFRQTDERIEKLVSAIGQFISRSDAPPA